MTAESQICSICDLDYDDCAHVIGRPYMGKFCYVTLIGIEAEEVSLVDDPADKDARVISYTENGQWINRMTLRPDDSVEGTTAGDQKQTGS